MRDSPRHARWLSISEADALEAAIHASSPAGDAASTTDLRRALLHRDVLLLSAHYFGWSLGIYGFVLWLPSIVKQGAGLAMGQTGLLTAVPYVLAIVLMLTASHFSDRFLQREIFVWPFLLLSGLAMLGSFLFAPHSFTMAFLCMIVAGGCMYAPYGPFFSIIPERVPRAVAGEVFAMVNSVGALGGFVGSYLVGLLRAVTHSQRAGYLLMSLSLVISALLLTLLPRTSAPTAEPGAMQAPEPDLA